MEITPRFVRLALVFGLAPLIVDLPVARGEVLTPDPRLYINVDYQFSAELPRGYPACVSEHTNHGVEILLDRQAGWKDDDGVPHIVLFANYNVATEAETPERLAHFECGYRTFQRIVWLRRVTFGRRKAAGCRRYMDGKKSRLRSRRCAKLIGGPCTGSRLAPSFGQRRIVTLATCGHFAES
jgi:hypothetical protein